MYVYVITGSEDGTFAAATSSRKACVKAAAYVHGPDFPQSLIGRMMRELKAHGYTELWGKDDTGYEARAEIERFKN